MYKQASDEKQKDSPAKATFMQATVSILEEKPFHRISVNEIVVRSGYSRGSFYKYFENKYDLLKTIMENEATCFTDILCGNMQRGETTEVSSDYTYQSTLSVFYNVLEKKTLYRLIFQSEIPECNMEKFCHAAAQNFLEKAEIKRKSGPVTQELGNIFYYCNTWLYMSYIKFWAEQDFSITPESMAEQVTAFVDGQKAEVVLHRKEE